MLVVKFKHSDYQDFVRDFLSHYFISTGQHITVLTRADYVLKLWSADLTGIIALLKGCYAKSNKGAPPKDPATLFRSLFLMTLTGETSISKWVDTLRADPFYALVSGFYPACFSESGNGVNADSLPGVGTFYDFMDRLIQQERILSKSKLRKFKRKPKKKQKKNEKMVSSKPGVVERVVKRILKHNHQKLVDRPESTLNQILKDLFVMPSFSMGIMGAKDGLVNIAGDGTCMPTHASHYGKKVCNCKLKPYQQCDCPRLFSDPTATWGWDSYNEQYFYGHTFHGFTASDSFYSLPIHIKCVTGKRHDSVTGSYHLKELVDLYPELKFSSGVFDSAYDAHAFYLLLLHYGINPIIDLNSRSASPQSDNEFVVLDDKGVPHCKGLGHKLRNWGLMKKSYRRKWLFPVQCDHCDACPVSSSKTYYTKSSDNPRFFSPILRDNPLWRKLYKRRSTTERAWDRVKNDFNARAATTISREGRIVRVFLGTFCCFIDAWACESNLTIPDIFPALLKVAA